jgi:SAM-dependent methyltransferase
METSTYAVEAEVEASHWWFVARRQLIADIIAQAAVAPSARVLDVGTSTGTNLRLLRDLGFANRRGLDPSDSAIRWCTEKGLGQVTKGDVCSLPFGDGDFELVLATDIIEHVDDDVRAVSEIRRVLAPGGTAIISVPAFRSLWGLQDDVSHHKRRYRKRELLEVIERAGLTAMESFYFNYLLFAPIWAARQLIRIAGITLKSENQVNNGALNWLLTRIFLADVATARILRPPFGVSIMAVARRDSL